VNQRQLPNCADVSLRIDSLVYPPLEAFCNTARKLSHRRIQFPILIQKYLPVKSISLDSRNNLDGGMHTCKRLFNRLCSHQLSTLLMNPLYVPLNSVM